MLQGVWSNAESGDLSFYADGDSIYFPDSTSVPCYFCIVGDSLALEGTGISKYLIIRQTPHLFVFKNLNGEQIKLKKIDDNSYISHFSHKKVMQRSDKIINKDSTLTYRNEKIRFVIHIAQGNEKVYKHTYSSDGMLVGNTYYDNDVFVKLDIQKENEKNTVFDAQLKKQDFAKIVPASFISQAIFSSLQYAKTDSKGVHFSAVFSLPETVVNVCYNVDLCIDRKGQLEITDIE